MDTLEERIIWWQLIFKDTELICKSSRFISIYEKILVLVQEKYMGMKIVPKAEHSG